MRTDTDPVREALVHDLHEALLQRDILLANHPSTPVIDKVIAARAGIGEVSHHYQAELLASAERALTAHHLYEAAAYIIAAIEVGPDGY